MPRSRICSWLGVLLFLSGCLGNPPQRVRVRRDAKVIDQEEKRIRPDAYEEWLTAQQDQAESLRLTPELKREENYNELTRLSVKAVLESIPADPFASYEKDRLDHLYRNWSDHAEPPPEPESDVVAEDKGAEDKGDEAKGDEDQGDEDQGDEDQDKGDDSEYEDDKGWDE